MIKLLFMIHSVKV